MNTLLMSFPLLVATMFLGTNSCHGQQTHSPQQAKEASVENAVALSESATGELSTLSKEHPRLLISPSEIARIKKQAKTDSLMAAAISELKRDADGILALPPVPERRDGLQAYKFLEVTSRGALRNISTLALMYLLESDSKYLDRAWAELKKATSHRDWNPQHFLSTAEMTLAVAIGYDWLYDSWTPEQREELRKAIVEKGLVPGDAELCDGSSWVGSHSYWNAVCSGGLLAGALAVADTDPALASRLVRQVRGSLSAALQAYGPNGGYEEGVAYWNYGTSFLAIASAVQLSALGDDAGLSNSEAVARSWMFPLLLTGPTGIHFNFGGSHDYIEEDAHMQWLARRYHNPGLAGLARSELADRLGNAAREKASSEGVSRFRAPTPKRMGAFEILWMANEGTTPDVLPLDYHFLPAAGSVGVAPGATETAVLRGSWTDPDTFWIAIKAGGNSRAHANPDAGSFVLDAVGERWAIQLGCDGYSLPDSFDDMNKAENRPKPDDDFRRSTQSKNTLTINGANQLIDAAAPITGFGTGPLGPAVLLDLSPVYAGQATSLHRGIALPGRDHPDGLCATIRDEWNGVPKGETVRWAMVTDAYVQVDRREALLTKNGKSLLVTIVDGPDSAKLHVLDAPPGTSTENRIEGVRILAIDVMSDGGPQSLQISFTRIGTPQPESLSLNRWIKPQ